MHRKSIDDFIRHLTRTHAVWSVEIQYMFKPIDMLKFIWDSPFIFFDLWSRDDVLTDPGGLPILITYLYSYLFVCIILFAIFFAINHFRNGINNYAFLFFLIWSLITINILIMYAVPSDIHHREQLQSLTNNIYIFGLLGFINVLVLWINLIYSIYIIIEKTMKKSGFIWQQVILYTAATPLIIRLMIWPVEFYVYLNCLYEYYDKILPVAI